MEQNNTTTPVAPQGKGMGVAGFVISLVAFVLWFIVSGIAMVSALVGGGMGLAIFWLIVSLLGTILSVMGMMKLGKTGGKRGLAIAGMVIGIVASIMSVWTVIGVNTAHKTVGDKGKEFLENLQDTAKMRESINEMINNAMDSTNTH